MSAPGDSESRAKQVERHADAVMAAMSEYLDGFIIVGFPAGMDDPIMVVRAADPKTKLALITLAQKAAAWVDCNGSE